jgi:hypothetical protein
MITFTHVRARTFVLDELNVSWELEIDPDEKILDYELTVTRSQSPEDDFKDVSPGLFDVYSFVDKDVNTRSKWRKFYYKVRARHIPSGRVFFSDVASTYFYEDIPFEGLEIIRRNNLFLYGAGSNPKKRFGGNPCWVFLRRSFGPRCSVCYNHKLKQTIRDDCPDCLGTGRHGGYFKPILTNFQIDAHAQAQDHSNLGMLEPSRTRAWTSNYPLLSPQDFIVEVGSNRRWEIEAVQTTELNRMIIRQLVSLYGLDQDSSLYKLGVPSVDL